MARLRDLGERLTVSGDGRCDSPGFCAKYGAYTLIENRINQVIALELVQVSFFNYETLECFSHPRKLCY